MRADSSLRELRNSLINEDAAIMKVIHPVPLAIGEGHFDRCLSDAFRLRPGRICSNVFAPTRPQRGLQSAFAALVIADANRLIHAREKNLPVADLARARGSQNGLHRFLDHGVGQNHLELRLGDQIHAVLTSAVDLGMPLLPSVTAHLKHRHAFDADFMQRSFDRFQLRVLNDRLDLRHNVIRSCSAFLNIVAAPECSSISAWLLRRRFPIISLFAVSGGRSLPVLLPKTRDSSCSRTASMYRPRHFHGNRNYLSCLSGFVIDWAQNLNCKSSCMRRGGRAATGWPNRGEDCVPIEGREFGA